MTQIIGHQLFEGLTYLHANSIVHRDIDIHNIIVLDTKKVPNIAITGFHKAQRLNKNTKTKMKKSCGHVQVYQNLD